MSEDLKAIKHELGGIQANLTACFKRLTADRRSKNPYAELGFEVLARLDKLTRELDEKKENQRKHQ